MSYPDRETTEAPNESNASQPRSPLELILDLGHVLALEVAHRIHRAQDSGDYDHAAAWIGALSTAALIAYLIQ